ncbi:hypothetical protein [Nonomuraea sp. NPDC002799]
MARRDDDALVDACAEAGIAYVPFFPIGGFQPLTTERLDAVAARHDATVPQVAATDRRSVTGARRRVTGHLRPSRTHQGLTVCSSPPPAATFTTT